MLHRFHPHLPRWKPVSAIAFLTYMTAWRSITVTCVMANNGSAIVSKDFAKAQRRWVAKTTDQPVKEVDIVPLSDAVKVWPRVAALSFGGPAGQIAVMNRILVDEKRWIDEHRFLHALNYCLRLPRRVN